MSNWFLGHLHWVIAGVFCLLGLAGLGRRDLFRLSLRRIAAIAGVCVRQSLRRRILWITPLAMVGVVVVAHFQRPLDDEGAIRQTAKFCLFAAGLVSVMAMVILACTNLPKEIESRVIYTIVTKPATRLEIMLGKMAGFAAVSGLILAIMGIFTFVYVEGRARTLAGAVRQQLAFPDIDPALHDSLQHYADVGLLHAEQYEEPVESQAFAFLPKPDDKIRWMRGNWEEEALAPFDLPDDMLRPIDDPEEAKRESLQNAGWVVEVKVHYRRFLNSSPGIPTRRETKEGGLLPQTAEHATLLHVTPPPRPSPGVPGEGENAGAATDPFHLSSSNSFPPGIGIEILGPDRYNVIPQNQISWIDVVPRAAVKRFMGYAVFDPEEQASTETATARYYIPAFAVDNLRSLPGNQRRIYVCLHGILEDWLYGLSPGDVTIRSASPQQFKRGEKLAEVPPARDRAGNPLWEIFRGRSDIAGNQLRGGEPADAPVGVFAFRGLSKRLDLSSGELPMELNVLIQRGGGEAANHLQERTTVQVVARNLATGKSSLPEQFVIESKRRAFFSIPAEFAAGGNFDLQLRCLTPTHNLMLKTSVIRAVAFEQPFAFNLAKSLFVLWMLTMLVAVVSLFSSTFVSWPIAVILTLVLLLAQWGMQQVGDTSALGMGRGVIQQMFPDADPALMQTFTSSVVELTRFMNKASRFLPDISQFSAIEDIDQGQVIAPRVIADSVKQLVLFGSVMLVLGYLLLRQKEVAP